MGGGRRSPAPSTSRAASSSRGSRASLPDRTREIVVYCAVGARSAFAAKTLERARLRARRPRSPAASRTGSGTASRRRDAAGARRRRSARATRRHLLIPEVGEEGQQKLLESRVLLIGAGGLGSPASLYLAAAGVGTLGIVDADVVDDSNLQRQIVHSTERLGEPKVSSAKRTIEALNPDVEVKTYEERLTSENVERILGEGWDVIVDGADNFPTRYLVNDASVWHDIPVVHGSIYRFEGQVTVFKPNAGPCYRCLFPTPPPPELAPSCAEGGVLGVLPGIIGSLQASEALKLAARDRRAAPAGCCCSTRSRRPSTRCRSSAIPRARSAARARRSPSTSTTSSSAPGPGAVVTAGCRIPPTLRAEVGGEREVEASGDDVREVLDDLVDRFPALAAQLFEDGELAPFVNVYVDGEDVRTLDGLDTTVDERDR